MDPRPALRRSREGAMRGDAAPNATGAPAAGGAALPLDAAGRPPGLGPWDVALCVSGAVISCENAVVVAVICYAPALRTPMFVLVGSLAAADLLAGLGLILHFACASCARSQAAALATAGLLVTAFAASVGSLLALTVDRYLSLYNALSYDAERTAARTYAMLVLTWGASACYGLLPLAGWNCLRDAAACSVVRPLAKDHLAVLAVAFFLVLAAMLQLCAQICKIVRRHAHQIAVQRHFLATSRDATTRRGIATLAVILGTFASCWLPFAVCCLLGDHASPPLYTYATILPATSHSMINPVIYAFRNQEVQRALWALCCGCCPSALPFRPRSPSDV